MTPEQERAAFEAWATKENLAYYEQSELRFYSLDEEPYWRSWQARAQMAQAAPAIVSVPVCSGDTQPLYPQAAQPAQTPQAPLGSPAAPQAQPAEAQEPVGRVLRDALQPPLPSFPGLPWCREVLLYSPDNQGVYPENCVMLYAAPPARQPLTEPEIEAAWRSVGTEPDGSNLAYGCNLPGWTRAIRWTEGRHGITAAKGEQHE